MKVRIQHTDAIVELDRLLAEGACGAARFLATNSRMLGKDSLEGFDADKLNYLLRHEVIPSRSGHRYAWPKQLGLDPESGDVLCYFMDLAEDSVDFETLLGSVYWLPETYLYAVALNHVQSLIDLHRAGYRRGDMPNSRVHSDAKITEIDLDSLQVSHGEVQYPCGLVKDDTIPPELIDLIEEEDPRFETTIAHDCWSIAVMIWMLLCDGEHPFACRWLGAGGRPNILPRIREGLWPHSGRHREVAPRNGSRTLRDLDPDLAQLFRQTFELGHSSPADRPSLDTWELVLSRLRGSAPVELDAEQWNAVKEGRPCRKYVSAPRVSWRRATGLTLVATTCTAGGIYLPRALQTVPALSGQSVLVSAPQPGHGVPTRLPAREASQTGAPIIHDRKLLDLPAANEDWKIPSLWNLVRQEN